MLLNNVHPVLRIPVQIPIPDKPRSNTPRQFTDKGMMDNYIYDGPYEVRNALPLQRNNERSYAKSNNIDKHASTIELPNSGRPYYSVYNYQCYQPWIGHKKRRAYSTSTLNFATDYKDAAKAVDLYSKGLLSEEKLLQQTPRYSGRRFSQLYEFVEGIERYRKLK